MGPFQSKTLFAVAKALQSAPTSGQFHTSFKTSSTDFIFEVNGFGSVDANLSTKAIRALIKEGHLASFGWRDQTIVDTRVRNVWEIPSRKIKFNKKNFNKIIGPALKRIQTDLGLDEAGELTADLHNLLIYEPGQFFSMHQDSEKSDGMLATMTVTLPLPYSGGALIVEQQGDRKTFNPPRIESDQLSVIAFYADCYHEVKPIKTGHKISLTFNLYFNASNALPATHSNDALTRRIEDYFKLPLDGLRESERHPRWLVYLLDHHYSQKGLSWQSLKGSDRTRAAQLLGTGTALGLNSHLTLAELHETWETEEEYSKHGRFYDEEEDEGEDSKDHTLGDLIDQEYTLKHWLDSEGKKVNFPEHDVPDAMFCWTKANDEFKPFDSMYEGYMGNYGNTLDRWYHRAAIVLWMKKDDLLSRFAIDSTRTLKAVKTVTVKNPKEGCKLLRELGPIWNSMDSRDNEQTRELLEIAKHAQSKSIAQEILSRHAISIVCKQNAGLLAELAEDYGETWLLGMLEKWSQEPHSSLNKISELSSIVETWTEFRSAVLWLTNYQMRAFIHSDSISEKHGNHTSLAIEQSVVIKAAKEILKITRDFSLHEISDRIVQHIIKHERVYPPLSLADLALSLAKKSHKDAAWLELAAQTLERLGKVTQKRQANDFAIKEKIPCACDDCLHLRLFLRSTEQKKMIWPLAKGRRQHIHHIIDSMGIYLSHETQRTGSPQKLILTKLDKYFVHEAKQKLKAKQYMHKLQNEFKAVD